MGPASTDAARLHGWVEEVRQDGLEMLETSSPL